MVGGFMRTTLIFVLLIFLSVIVSCATHQAKKQINREYVGSADSATDPRSIKSALTVAGGPVSNVVGATLITESLVKSELTAMGKKNMETPENIQKGIQSRLDDLVKNKTCFEVNIFVYGDIEKAQFKNWRFRVEQAGKIVDAFARNVQGISSVPKIHMVNPPLGTSWNNNTYACTEKPLSLEASFKFYAIPQWEGPMNDGKPVVLEFELGQKLK
jgi:hypothetical protein